MDRGDAASLAAAVTPDLKCWPLDSIAAEAMLVHRRLGGELWRLWTGLLSGCRGDRFSAPEHLATVTIRQSCRPRFPGASAMAMPPSARRPPALLIG